MEDRKLADALYNSEKNRAEKLMIVDLTHNDLSRISVSHSVKVPHLFSIERRNAVCDVAIRRDVRDIATATAICGARFLAGDTPFAVNEPPITGKFYRGRRGCRARPFIIGFGILPNAPGMIAGWSRLRRIQPKALGS